MSLKGHAIFPTPTKTDTVYAWGIDGLTKAVKTSKLPLVAIGGINKKTFKQSPKHADTKKATHNR